jgi:hypothetical protein
MSEPVKVLPMAQLLRLAKEKEAKEKAERESTFITGVPEYSSTEVLEEQLRETEFFIENDASVDTGVPEYRSTPVIPREKFTRRRTK